MPCPFSCSTLLSWTPTVIIMIIDILSLLTLLLSLLPSLSSSVILSLNIIWSIIWNIVILRNLLSFWSFENYLSIRNLESCEILNVVVQRKDQTESKNLSSFLEYYLFIKFQSTLGISRSGRPNRLKKLNEFIDQMLTLKNWINLWLLWKYTHAHEINFIPKLFEILFLKHLGRA